MNRLSDEKLSQLYERFAERATQETCGVSEDIDVMLALAELIEMRSHSARPDK
jgi:hypothetical protein